MSPERLEDRLARLDRERQDADRQYNDALTALDAALQKLPELPPAPKPYDATAAGTANQSWKILPDGAPEIRGVIKGRIQGLIWRMVGPALQKQQTFNAALVEHLNKNIAGHEEARRAADATIAVLRDHISGLVQFQSRLIAYLQTLTLFVDTKDRAVAGRADVVHAGVNAMADDWLKRWESLAARESRLLAAVQSLDHLRAPGAAGGSTFDDVRATAQLAQQTALTVKRELERFAKGEPVTQNDLNAFKYLGFEEAFRGSQAVIRQRLEFYVPIFSGLSDVLDIGCGRGEFVELLGRHGVSARGLDLNHEMVETARSRGLEVVEGDALSYLQSLPDASLGGVFAAQVVEHLPPDYLSKLVDVAGQKVRPGGLLVLETINPACWLAFFESYIRDLTHVQPLHPETLQFLARASGFHDVRVEYLSPVPEGDKLQAVAQPGSTTDPHLAALMDAFNENTKKLNDRLFTYMDYAVVARR